MSDKFLIPTQIFKELLILDYISNNQDVTQRGISHNCNIAVSMVNQYLTELERKGMISKKYISPKNISYMVSSNGIKRLKYLSILYLHETQKLYNNAKSSIIDFLISITNLSVYRIVLYGAGEVAEIIIQTIITSHIPNLVILAVIDDDIEKQNKKLLGVDIVSKDILNSVSTDGIIITSYKDSNQILEKLKTMNYKSSKIYNYFY